MELEVMATDAIPRRHSIARTPPLTRGASEGTPSLDGGNRKAISPQEALTSGEEDPLDSAPVDQSSKRKKECNDRPSVEHNFFKTIIDQCSTIEEATSRMSGGKLQFTREQQARVNEAVSSILKATLRMQAADRENTKAKNQNAETINAARDQSYVKKTDFKQLAKTISGISEAVNELKKTLSPSKRPMVTRYY